jgi:hypothetical protein
MIGEILLAAVAMPPLAEWNNFYVIIGSSAAALTGLQFVVIAINAESQTSTGETLDVFATPTVIHFCAVLLMSAIITTPRHTPVTLSVCLAVSGLAGLAYMVWVSFQIVRQTLYVPVLSDWIWFTWLPLVAYTSMSAAGILVRWHPQSSLYGIAASALLLLYIGIHNSWDAAVWMATMHKKPPTD